MEQVTAPVNMASFETEWIICIIQTSTMYVVTTEPVQVGMRAHEASQQPLEDTSMTENVVYVPF